MSWSASDNFFVNGKLEVFSIDLFSEPLKTRRSKCVVYDGPKGDDFKQFLISKNLRVNCRGKAIVDVQKRDDQGEYIEDEYDSYLLEKVVLLGPFGFPNKPLLKLQLVNELETLQENTRVELAKKNDAFNELQSLLANTKAELAKKYEELNEFQSLLENSEAELAKKDDVIDEFQSLLENSKVELAKKDDVIDELMKRKIDQNWNSEHFRLTIVAITTSMKRVFIHCGLEPPTSGDPDSVLRFLEMLRDLILHKECGDTFLVAANEILASIATIFEKRNGLSIGMRTNDSRSTITPNRLIKNLFTLRGFMDSHFLIDGSVIVRDFHLMNEDDLPIIFRDSAAHVAELKQKMKGTKSIDNIDANSILYGYFNIPRVGMFKGILTRVHVNLPDEIMVKLRVGKHDLNEKRFWFVYANGWGVFEDDYEYEDAYEYQYEEEEGNLENIKITASRWDFDGWEPAAAPAASAWDSAASGWD